ncbi:SEL1-like repeat protein [Candidatus Obscuribacterales bacterium]|nr:SEL1-like repeat protein [Candidatus Obscuribacterales bacterium]MBX3153292.1 SEL1-like repeat protein [Candidatus Obscuribacterales bacterium]
MNDDALKSLVTRAESGNADAQYELAVLMLDESSPEDDDWEVDRGKGSKALEQGARWLVIAAQNGHSEAQNDLAKRYHYGIDFPENQSKAFEWFSRAAESECAEAQFFLGEIYTADDLVAYDIETALTWYERSAQNGHQWAQLALFDIYRNGADLSLPDLEKSLYWGRKAGEQGNLAAQVSLGKMFFEGETVARDPLEAAFWLHLSADFDDDAKSLLATLYLNGHGVEKDVARAAELFRSLARKGDSDAMVQLAMVLFEMYRPPHDEIHGWLTRASEAGNAHARDMLEEIESSKEFDSVLQEGDEQVAGEYHSAPARSAEQWRALAESGDAEAQFSYARMLEDGNFLQGDIDEAVRWYRRSAEQGHVGAFWSLSKCYESGLGVEQDEEKALQFLNAAAEGGNADAQLQLGWQYFFGSKVLEDKAKAFELFKAASDQFNLSALVWQGHCYQHGAGVSQDRTRACELYLKAANLGMLSAQFKLGMMYLLGWGVSQNSEEAAKWLNRAARRNHTASMVELGRMHLTGDGVEESQELAINLFRQAAELGDPDGLAALSYTDVVWKNDLRCQIVDGLSVAHDAGVVHRDICPANILLVDPRTPLELAKIIDFGIAKRLSPEGEQLDPLSITGPVTGIPAYLSPEQCQGQPLDSRSDIYSLGCVLFETLTGVRAIRGNSFFEIICSHLYQPPASIREARPEANFGRDLDAVIRKMMAKDPSARYQNLEELREDLIQLLAAAA